MVYSLWMCFLLWMLTICSLSSLLLAIVISIVYTLQCLYNVVNFLANSHKIHPITCLLGQSMWCILWVQTPNLYFSQSLHWCMQYHVILDIMTALDCIMYLSMFVENKSPNWNSIHKCSESGLPKSEFAPKTSWGHEWGINTTAPPTSINWIQELKKCECFLYRHHCDHHRAN